MEHWHVFLSAALLPLVAAAQRYSVAYGYEGVTKAEARRQFLLAFRAGGLLVLLTAWFWWPQW